jgi:hypothetical protein
VHVAPTEVPHVVIEPQQPHEPQPNNDGNGIGVTVVPIPGHEQPQTTVNHDPLAPPPEGMY